MDPTRQLMIMHFSDIHFGKKHRFTPPASAAGDVPHESDYPDLTTNLLKELTGPDPGCPVIICITGDLTETGYLTEFDTAYRFIQQLVAHKVLGSARGLANLFTVPGNHDIDFTATDLSIRWREWIDFHNRLFGTSAQRDDPWGLVSVHDRVDDLGAIIVCLNSAIYVQQGKPDQDRGRLDDRQLKQVDERLESISRKRLESAIRVALVHHHPVLIPNLVEPGRGFDAIHNADMLLTILRSHGFHLVLHGHKHNPHTFSHDVRAAFDSLTQYPMFIVAGGSLSSKSLPLSPQSSNTYNRIAIKWHPDAHQGRVRIETRALSTFKEDGTPRLASHWRWRTLRVHDEHFLGGDQAPQATAERRRAFAPERDGPNEAERAAEYRRTRGNLPVAEVMPSLEPGQAYEARLWIVKHESQDPSASAETPEEVIWSAGRKFPVVSVNKHQDPLFCAAFSYWGSMLVQARLRFADGYSVATHLYARLPGRYESRQ